MKKTLITLIILMSVSVSKTETGDADFHGITGAEIQLDDKTLISYVAPFPSEYFNKREGNKEVQILMDKYLSSLLEWDNILLNEFTSVPGHIDMGYYGDGRNVEDAVRPVCYAALVNAFLSKIDKSPEGTKITQNRRLKMEDHAVKALRYLTYSHITGKGECAGGLKWGNVWQSSMWTRAAALAGWILWDKLDEGMKINVTRMLEFEANRFIGSEPKNSEFNDTGAEENAWNTQCTSLAYNMMPLHPNRDKWDFAAKKYMYNCFSVAADRIDSTIGDNGKMISEWVTTVNAHPDYMVENHQLVHIDYLRNTLCMLMENVLLYELMGNPVPSALFHHEAEVFDILKKSMMREAVAVSWGSNDWRITHGQAVDLIGYTVINQVKNDRAAAYLENIAVDYMLALQQKNKGYYNFRRDLEWSGFAASRILNAYLVHAVSGEGSLPLSEEEYNNLYNNITYFPYSKAVIHRTSTKFASFSWGSAVLALSYNKDGSWQNWPRESSYIGIVNGMEAKRKEIIIEKVKPELNNDGFNITGRFRRNGNGVELIQDVSFTSLKGDITVYIERLTKVSGTVISRETGLVGHEFELDEPERILYTGDGSITVSPDGKESKKIFTSWLNLGGKTGYVVCRDGQKNMITYHSSWERNRNCDYINLIGESSSDWTRDWACLVTFLNQNQAATSIWADKVIFRVKGNTATCEIGNEKVSVSFDN